MPSKSEDNRLQEDKEAFDALAALGFRSDYVDMSGSDPRIIKPMITAEQAIAQGFFPKGTKVKWVNKNGYPHEREVAAATLNEDDIYEVELCRIGRSSSTYQLKDIYGRWNSVMFEKVEESVSD